ncbi:hypothetical protein PT300_06050 [Enterobacteriaceae bacterium ESL0689]|nr:hypothetical protein [Enterobacteriaceae bacterium ESL0689]
MANHSVVSKISKTSAAKIFFIPKIKALKKNNIHYIVTGVPVTMKDKLKLKIARLFGVQVYMYFFGTDESIDNQIRANRDYLDGVYYNRIPAR